MEEPFLRNLTACFDSSRIVLEKVTIELMLGLSAFSLADMIWSFSLNWGGGMKILFGGVVWLPVTSRI